MNFADVPGSRKGIVIDLAALIARIWPLDALQGIPHPWPYSHPWPGKRNACRNARGEPFLLDIPIDLCISGKMARIQHLKPKVIFLKTTNLKERS